MTSLKKLGVVLACALFAGCAGLNAQRREAAAAAEKTAAAEAAVSGARQAGAAKCAAKEFKNAEVDLGLARNNLQKKDYALAGRLAASAVANADAASAKCAEAKKKSRKK